MHDYVLERLNTRSFEQLIQSLGLVVLGNQLSIFGDGPDGGREASFDGGIDYPKPENWNGFGIVQAKFRQKPDSVAKKNADWVIRQLESEFKKFKPRKKKGNRGSEDRLCPSYYILATNLVLSPVIKTGGKDRVRNLLESYKETYGLVDYAIWDGDQICRFLDTQPAIRTTYSAWLLPGDVLSEVLKSMGLGKNSFSSTIRRYLESELLDDQFAKLGQGGYTDAKNIPLCSVFVDLPIGIENNKSYYPTSKYGKVARPDPINRNVNEPDAPVTFLSLFLEEGRQLLKPSRYQGRRLGEKTAIRSSGRMVLIGGPGQGKTTVGQYACQLLRAALLRATGGPFSVEVEQALVRIETLSMGLPAVNSRRYPLRVDLKHFAASLAPTANDKAENLLDYLVKRIANRTNTTVSKDDFRVWLSSYPWVLVLDGLDEVPASSNRQQVLQAIRDFVSVEAHSLDADLLILATTRPQGYSEEFDPSFFHHIPLLPLNAEQALEYGRRLASARHPDQRTRVEELTSSLARATSNSATVRLMQSPLQVTIMLALIEGGGEPPEQKWKLFHDYYDVIYRREKERGTAFSAILSRYEPDIHWIHHRAGWLLQQRNAAAGTTDAKLTHEEFELIAEKRLIFSGHNDETKRGELVKTIRLAATDRLVLLVGNTEEAIGFEIRSLQEFMAAEHFFDGGELCVQRTLHTISAFSYWRNVFLFAAARVFFERQELIDSVIAICSEMNEDPSDPGQRTILSGSRLALALLKDGATRNQPASTRVIARIGARILNRDGDTARDFAELFISEAEEIWKDELLSIPKNLMSYSNWLLCFLLADSGKPWVAQILEDFPWKSNLVNQFIKDTNNYKGQLEVFWNDFDSKYFSSHPLKVLLWRMDQMEELHNVTVNAAIKQFQVLLEPIGRETWHLKIGANNHGFGFIVRSSKNLKSWASLEYPLTTNETHPEWLICKCISEFARVPTMSNLAETVENIAMIDPDCIYTETSWVYPWQLSVCVNLKRNGASWSDIVSHIRAGRLGTELDWARWDEESRAGLNISELRLSSDNSISDEFKGLIIKNSGWSFGASPDEVIQFAQDLSEDLKRHPDLRGQKELLDLCFFGVCRKLDGFSHEGLSVVARLFSVCKENNLCMNSRAVVIIIKGAYPINIKREMLAALGSGQMEKRWIDDFDHGPSVASANLSEILKGIASFDDWYCVLRALSFLPPMEVYSQIPATLIDQLASRGGVYEPAAICLRLYSLCWTESECNTLVPQAIALNQIYAKHSESLFNFIDTAGKSGQHLEAFLIEFIRQPKLNEILREEAYLLLVKLVERRTATNKLPDPSEKRLYRELQ